MLWTPDNDWGNVQSSAVGGVSVTPGQNTKGSYSSSLMTVSNDSYLIEIITVLNATGAQARDTIMDVGIDYAGGTSYTVFIADLLESCSEMVAYRFPVFIPAGATLACRASVNNATVGTVTAYIRLWQKPTRPENIRYGYVVDSFGVTAATSSGTAVTPGNGSEGAWVSLGSLSHDYFFWEAGLGVNDSTMNQRRAYLDVAYGDATNKVLLVSDLIAETFSTEMIMKSAAGIGAIAPSGTTLYVRAMLSGTLDSSYSMMAYGVRA